VIKLISFIVFFNSFIKFFYFNVLKILRQPGYFFFKVKPTIFFYKHIFSGFLKVQRAIYLKVTCCEMSVDKYYRLYRQ